MLDLTSIKRQHTQQGIFTLFLGVIVLIVIVVVMSYVAYIVTSQNRMLGNVASTKQAFEAAEAGVQYGIADLSNHYSAIKTTLQNSTSNPASTASITKTLTAAGNGQQVSFTVYYRLPAGATNQNTIIINSRGYSADGKASYTITQPTYAISGPTINSTVKAKGDITLSGNGSVKNLASNISINSGGEVSFSGNANSQSATGSSNRNNIGSDVIQNDIVLANTTGDALFESLFDMTKLEMQASATATVNSLSVSGNNHVYQTGGTIWVNGNASISGNGKVGSAANPVLLIVNGGNFSTSGNGVFYGVVYVIKSGSGAGGNITYSGNGSINGASVAEGTVSISGNGGSYSQDIVDTLASSTTLAIVPDSWIDY